MSEQPCKYCLGIGKRNNGYYEYTCNHCGGTGLIKSNPMLAFLSTKELSDELRKRQGVESFEIDPYETKAVEVEGPAIVIINKD